MKRCVVYITDENYVMPTCVSIVSLCLNIENECDIIIITYKISDESRRLLYSLGKGIFNVQIIEYNENSIFEKFECKFFMSPEIHVSYCSMIKFYLADILEYYDKALYLDSDVIIQKNISDLWDIDIDGYFLAAANDMGDTFYPDGSSAFSRRIMLNNMYFNSGVMLLNLREMRKSRVSQLLFDYRTNEINFFMDQDAYNYVLGEKRKKLSYEFNFLATVIETMSLDSIVDKFELQAYKSVQKCIENQRILHLCTERKPWIYYIPWFTDIFMKYYSESPYSGTEIELKSGVAELIQEKDYIIKSKVWPFPFDRIKKNSNVVIYGAGDVGTDFFKQLELTSYCNEVLWVDQDWKRKCKNVKSPEYIKTFKFDYIVIAIVLKTLSDNIRAFLIDSGISSEMIIQMDNTLKIK